MEIERFKNSHNYDVFLIETKEGKFEISFQNNLDLFWRPILKQKIVDSLDEYEFTITKENYYIYKMFENLYNRVKKGLVFYGYNDLDCKETKYNNKLLYKDGVIDWHSDDFDYDEASRLIIKKDKDTFKVIFKKSKEAIFSGMFITYSVSFRNSGSRYEPFNIVFMHMYNELKSYDPNYHQIHVEEYIYKNKILKKNKII